LTGVTAGLSVYRNTNTDHAFWLFRVFVTQIRTLLRST